MMLLEIKILWKRSGGQETSHVLIRNGRSEHPACGLGRGHRDRLMTGCDLMTQDVTCEECQKEILRLRKWWEKYLLPRKPKKERKYVRREDDKNKRDRKGL